MELTIEQALQQGVTAHNQGNPQEAERLYRAILEVQPKHPGANHNLGLIVISRNQASAALPLFKIALDVNPKKEQFWLSYIDALIKDNQIKDAKRAIKKAKKKGFNRGKLKALYVQSIAPPDVTSPSQQQLKNLLDYYQAGRFDDAEKLAVSITQDFPENQFSWKILGALLGQRGMKAEALNAKQKAVQLVPQDAEAHYNLANALRELGRLDEAEANYTQAIALKPDHASAHYNLGITLKELGRLEEAEASYKEAIALKPDHAEAHSNLGNTLKELGRLGEAEASYKLAIKLKSDFAEAHCNLGNTLKELGRLEEAEASYKEAIALKPDYALAYWNLSLALNLKGNLAKGFELFKWRFKKKEIVVRAPRIAFCWDGKQSLKGKRFVIYDEQGLGDIIQFSRYLPLMVQKGAIVSFKVKHSLHKLFGTLSENITLITELPNDDELDFEVPLMSLPHLFETTLATVPGSTPYLYADEAKIKTWAEKLVKDKFRIGICWQGSKGKVDFGRSFPLSLYKDISEVPDVELISLHKGEGEDQHSGITFAVTTFGKEIDDGPYAFLDTAAVMMNCDLIITSDTAVAHLAGALGRQTWVALKHIPDWRWMLQTPKTPWYPTLTLYRQKTQGDWATVFATIKQDLCSLLNKKGY